METVKDTTNVVRVFRQVDMTGATLPGGSASKEGYIGEKLDVSRAVAAPRYVAAAGCWRQAPVGRQERRVS